MRGFFYLFLMATMFPAFADAASAPWVGVDLKGSGCSGGEQGHGPYDYTKRNLTIKTPEGIPDEMPPKLRIVEIAHFTPEVEGLIKGHSSSLEGDLDYTLRAWPNHHRALLSVIKYQLDVKNKLRRGKLFTPPECYLQRAIHFSSQDAVSYSLYGHYLRKMGHLEDAVKYYEKALALDPENAKFAYSFSLLLIDLKRYEEAVKYAKIAYQKKGAPKGLKQKLEKLGVWNEANPKSSVDGGASKSTSDSE